MRGRAFSIILDETTDIGNHEQIKFCVRWASCDLKVNERFVKFYRTESNTGEALEDLARREIKELGLSAETFLVSQGYDGGSNMSGIHNGVAARIRKTVQRAFFIHCRAHKLKLTLQDANSKNQEREIVLAR